MDSSPPLIFKKKTKSKPAQRKRESSPDDSEHKIKINGEEGEEEESPSTLAMKLKTKVKRNKLKSKLSFGGDEEEGSGEVFQLKKSRLSQKLSLGKNSTIPANFDQATITPSSGPRYDEAYLNELKASTPSTRPAVVAESGATPLTDDSLAIQTMDVDIEDATTTIPSESSIKTAKERRERLRKTGGSVEDDYISLSLTRREDIDQGPHPESRLVREEDELGEGDDEFAEFTSAQERIALGKKSRKKEAAQRREAMKEMIDDVEEEDEETMQWEQEQLRRGGHRTPDPGSVKVKKVYKPAPIPLATPIPTLPPALARLSEQLAKLTTSHANNTAALNNIALEREQVDEREKEMREMVGKAEEKRAWFGSFKEWVESVAGFLDEKYPMLEKLEEDYLSLLQERHDLIAQRRRAEDDDDLSTFLGALPEPPIESEELDELGRSIPKPTQAAMRRERRLARLERRQLRLQRRSKEEDEEGYSTDASLPDEDLEAYSEAVTSLASRTKEVLADVRAEEFRDPGKGRWSTWRQLYTDIYVNAWGGLGVVNVWEFWVRLEVVGWNCIEDRRSLDSFKWYKGLYAYSRPNGDEELGSDGDLVASMISTVVIPRLCKVVAGGGFDAYSTQHVISIIDLLEEIEATMEGEDTSKLQNLRKSAFAVFQNAIEETGGLLEKHHTSVKGPAPFNPEAIPARRRFLARRVKLLKNLLRWRKVTVEQYGIKLLITRLVDDYVLGIAENGWEVGGEEVARNVAKILPKDLVTAQLRQRLSLP